MSDSPNLPENWLTTGAPAGHIEAMVASAELVRTIDTLRRRFASELGVGMTEMQAMARILEAGEPVTPKHLAAALSMSTGAVTALLDRLEVHGVVVRSANPDDRRSTLVELTSAGRQAIQSNYDEYATRFERVAKERSEKELAVISAFFRDLAVAFDSTS